MLKRWTLDQYPNIYNHPTISISEKDDDGTVEIEMCRQSNKGEVCIVLHLEDSDLRDLLQVLTQVL